MIRETGDSGCADVAGVAAELGEVDGRAGRRNRKGPAADDLADPLDEGAADLVVVATEVHRPADDYRARVNDVDQGDDTNSQVVGRLHDQIVGEAVAVA